jgi:hypothetical protein
VLYTIVRTLQKEIRIYESMKEGKKHGKRTKNEREKELVPAL